jgi:uncharacterized membrane protein (TIGR02234 family)
VVILALTGAALVLLATGRIWAQGRVDGLAGVVPVSVTGRQAQPVLPALALIAGAAGMVLAICGPVVRWLAATALVLAGAGAGAAAVVLASDAARLLQPAASRLSGVTGSAIRNSDLSLWPWVTVLAGALVLLAGCWAMLAGAAWAAAGKRYQRLEAGAAAAAPTDDPAAAWDALTRGEDPTATDRGG